MCIFPRFDFGLAINLCSLPDEANVLVVVVAAMDSVQHAQDSVLYCRARIFPMGHDRAHTRMRRHDVEAMADAAVAADASVRVYFVGRPMVVATVHVPVPNTRIKNQSSTRVVH